MSGAAHSNSPFTFAPGNGVVGVPLRPPRRFSGPATKELTANEHEFVRARIHGEPVHLVTGGQHRRLQSLVRRGAISVALCAAAYFGAELIRGAL